MAAGERWTINVKGLTGEQISVEVANPQGATVFNIKELIQKKRSDHPLPFLQRLLVQTPEVRDRTVLQDTSRLSAYPAIKNGCTLFLVVRNKFELYIHDTRGDLHSVVVPSSEPENYPIAELVRLFEDKMGQRMDEYQFQYGGKPVEETRHGKQLTLETYGIKTGSTLFVLKLGFTLDITNPQVDLCFLVDCTGSMSSSIEAVKNNIKQLRDGLDAEYKGCDLRFSFVRYTDYDQPESTRTTWIDFTKSQPVFHGFVSAIRADGGGDAAEDIMGGLKAAFTKLSWRGEATKVLIHIADCPCHGRQYYEGCGDNYPNGDPAGISHEHMMEEVFRNEVQYWFGYINKSVTDKMIAVFNESLRRLSSNRMMIRQFEALQSEEVREGVHKAVTASVYAKKAAKKAAIRAYTLDPSTPHWGSITEQRARKTPPPGPLTLRRLQDGFTLEQPIVTFSFKCAPNPFAEGEESWVFRGNDLTNKRDIVLKQSKLLAAEYNSLEHYMMTLQVHTVTATYAREFNNEKAKPQSTGSIEMIPLDVVRCTNGSCYALEPFVHGKFEKYSNNVGFACSKSSLSPLLQAFSHYSWEKSGRSLLVCDLQGVQNGVRVQLHRSSHPLPQLGIKVWFD